MIDSESDRAVFYAARMTLKKQRIQNRARQAVQ